MIDTDNAEHGEAPPRRFGRAFYYACFAALIWTFVLLCFIVAKTSVAQAVVAAVTGVAAAVAAIIGIFQPPPFPTIDPKITRGVVAAALIADFALSGGWAGWSYYTANRTIDVLSTVTLNQNKGVLPGGHATVDVAVTAQRDTIVLVFRVVDLNEEIGRCVPNTSLLVTPDTAGNRSGTVAASSGVSTLVDLPAGATKLHLDIAVTNTRSDQNCAVDLSVESAKLRNK